MTKSRCPDSRLVHEGHERTPYGETSEAPFLAQGFIYEDAGTAERTGSISRW